MELKSNIYNSHTFIEDNKILILYKESFIKCDYKSVVNDILTNGKLNMNLLTREIIELVYTSNIVIVMLKNELGNTIQIVVKNRYI